MLALEHSPFWARLAKGYASYATYACHEDAKVRGVPPHKICPTEGEVVQAVTEGFTQGASRGRGLELDPFYEMFPTTYRRSYPWWRYSWGDTAPVITIKPTMSTGTKIAIGASIAAAIGVGVTLVARWR